MLYEILRYIKNFFITDSYEGKIKIEDGTVSIPFIAKYVLIEGSALNDGVYPTPPTDLIDEEFNGRISAICPPKEFVDLVEEITAWQLKNEPSSYTSESFGGYSYTKATNSSGGAVGWQTVFKDKLKVWKKI